MEDLRFCNEFMSKQQQPSSGNKMMEDSANEDDFNLKLSGDEGEDTVPP